MDKFQPSGVELAVVTRFPIVEVPSLGCSFGRYASMVTPSNKPTVACLRANSIDIQPKREVSPSSAGWAVGTLISTSPRDKITETLMNKSTKSTNSDTRSALPNVLCGNALKLTRALKARVGWLK